MSAKLSSSGAYRILTAGGPSPARPTGIDTTGNPYEDVRLDEPIQIWKLDQVDGSNATDIRIYFVLGIGEYPATSVTADPQIGEKVVASKNPGDNVEWVGTYRNDQQAWTIERADQPGRGWQALFEELSPNPHIAVRDLNEPFDAQLFLFKKVEE